MSEVWTKTQFSAGLSGRSSRDTHPEVLLRRNLHNAGFRFRLHREIGQRLQVDIVLPKYKIAIFVDGCFWHGCPKHGRAIYKGPNAEKWIAKMARVKTCETKAAHLLNESGFQVLRFWECSINDDVVEVVRQIKRLIHGAKRIGVKENVIRQFDATRKN